MAHRSALSNGPRVAGPVRALAGPGLIVVLLLTALLGPLVAPFGPLSPDGTARLSPPAAGHLLGTNHEGMDVLSRLLFAVHWDLIGSLVYALPIIALSLGLIRMRSSLAPGWADRASLGRWHSSKRTTRFWLTAAAGLVSLLPGLILAFAARGLGLFGIGEGPDFPEVGLKVITLGLLPWTILVLLLGEARHGTRPSLIVLTWCWSFALTVMLGSNGMWLTDWPVPGLGGMMDEALYLVPEIVGLDFAPWMFWPPVAAALVCTVALALSAYLVDRLELGELSLLAALLLVFGAAGLANVDRGIQMPAYWGPGLLAGAVTAWTVAFWRRRKKAEMS